MTEDKGNIVIMGCSSLEIARAGSLARWVELHRAKSRAAALAYYRWFMDGCYPEWVLYVGEDATREGK